MVRVGKTPWIARLLVIALTLGALGGLVSGRLETGVPQVAACGATHTNSNSAYINSTIQLNTGCDSQAYATAGVKLGSHNSSGIASMYAGVYSGGSYSTTGTFSSPCSGSLCGGADSPKVGCDFSLGNGAEAYIRYNDNFAQDQYTNFYICP